MCYNTFERIVTRQCSCIPEEIIVPAVLPIPVVNAFLLQYFSCGVLSRVIKGLISQGEVDV